MPQVYQGFLDGIDAISHSMKEKNMNKLFSVFRFVLSLVILAITPSALAQTSQVLKNLVANHGSLAAGDVVFTNFRLPYLAPNVITLMGDTYPPLPNGADVSVRASVAADGQINLVLTPIDPATGLPSPYLTNAAPGATMPTDVLRYVEFDVVVTNPQRRLHGFDRAFGPGTTSVYGNPAYNWVYFFDETHSNPYTQYVGVAFDQIVNGAEYFNAGSVTLPGGDRAGARFGVQWGINASDWGGLRIGTGSLDSITLRYSLANAVAPVASAPIGFPCFLPMRFT
jgi:hypothetical protein